MPVPTMNPTLNMPTGAFYSASGVGEVGGELSNKQLGIQMKFRSDVQNLGFIEETSHLVHN